MLLVLTKIIIVPCFSKLGRLCVALYKLLLIHGSAQLLLFICLMYIYSVINSLANPEGKKLDH